MMDTIRSRNVACPCGWKSLMLWWSHNSDRYNNHSVSMYDTNTNTHRIDVWSINEWTNVWYTVVCNVSMMSMKKWVVATKFCHTQQHNKWERSPRQTIRDIPVVRPSVCLSIYYYHYDRHIMRTSSFNQTIKPTNQPPLYLFLGYYIYFWGIINIPIPRVYIYIYIYI